MTYRLTVTDRQSGERRILREGLGDAEVGRLYWKYSTADPDREFAIEREETANSPVEQKHRPE